MGDQLANNPEALRLFFTEDIYLVQQGEEEAYTGPLDLLNAVDVVNPSFEPQNRAKASFDMPAINPLAVKKDDVEALASLQEPASSYESHTAASSPVPSAAVDKQAIHTEPELNFVFRGKNARNILILVYDELNEVTTEAGREVFKNIVKAKSLSANDYAIVNYASYKSSTFDQLRRFFNAKAILTFGVNAVQLGITDYPQHTVVTHDGVQLMFSSDLHELSMDVNIKKALWSVLKEMEL